MMIRFGFQPNAGRVIGAMDRALESKQGPQGVSYSQVSSFSYDSSRPKGQEVEGFQQQSLGVLPQGRHPEWLGVGQYQEFTPGSKQPAPQFAVQKGDRVSDYRPVPRNLQQPLEHLWTHAPGYGPGSGSQGLPS